jgi:hypothetical protein
MTFAEYGLDPQQVAPSLATAAAVTQASEALRTQVLRTLSQQPLPPPTGINA